MANIFPKGANSIPWKLGIINIVLVLTVIGGVTYYATPKWANVGYMPTQPVAYNHELHVDQLGLDCRYCHSFVDQSSHSNVPDAGTCMNCHSNVSSPVINPISPKIAPIVRSFESGDPVEWVRIHKVPDYVYFNHSVHVNRGVSCVECHGQINKMVTVAQEKPLSMAFCLNCHRNPETAIRPQSEIYNLDWAPEDPVEHAKWAEEQVVNWNVNPPQSCSGCHR
mgnify:CR=1 FL=1